MSGATLADAQRLMGTALVRRSSIDADPALKARTEVVVGRGVRLSPVEQLEIYREQFWLRHIGALKEDFATLEFLLGDEGFRALCEAYIGAHAPTSFTLRDLGERLATFVRDTAPFSADALLDDCARLEWSFIEAFDAPDALPLDPRVIAAAPEEAWTEARVVLHPSVRLVRMEHPAQVLRAALKAGTECERPDPEPTYVVVYRGPEKLMYIDVEPLAFALLEELARGIPLAAACEDVARRAGAIDASELEGKVGAWFQAWASYGWVSRVDFSAPPRPAESP